MNALVHKTFNTEQYDRGPQRTNSWWCDKQETVVFLLPSILFDPAYKSIDWCHYHQERVLPLCQYSDTNILKVLECELNDSDKMILIIIYVTICVSPGKWGLKIFTKEYLMSMKRGRFHKC